MKITLLDRTCREESNPDWGDLVVEILAGETDAMDRLYSAFRSLRYYFYRQLGPCDGDDAYHELIIDLFTQIRRGSLREPARLAAYAKAIAAKKVAGCVRIRVLSRNREVSVECRDRLATSSMDPEAEAIQKENESIAARVLLSVSARDREVLTRFYIKGERPEAIETAMGLTSTQFRLIKSRAKQRFTELCQARLNRRKWRFGESESRHGHPLVESA